MRNCFTALGLAAFLWPATCVAVLFPAVIVGKMLNIEQSSYLIDAALLIAGMAVATCVTVRVYRRLCHAPSTADGSTQKAVLTP